MRRDFYRYENDFSYHVNVPLKKINFILIQQEGSGDFFRFLESGTAGPSRPHYVTGAKR
jgi:hypothetical protein